MNAESKHGLITKLYESTLDNRVKWEKTSERDAFQVSVKDYVLTILLEGDERDPECLLRINNSDGDLVDEISWHTLKDFTTSTGEAGQTILYNLQKAARTSAMGADKAIKDILKELDELPPF